MDWAESVPQSKVYLKENVGVTLTSSIHPVRKLAASSSPRYCLPPAVTPASLTGHHCSSSSSRRAVNARFWKRKLQAAGSLEKGIGHFIFCRIMAFYMQVLKLTLNPKETEVPLV